MKLQKPIWLTATLAALFTVTSSYAAADVEAAPSATEDGAPKEDVQLIAVAAPSTAEVSHDAFFNPSVPLTDRVVHLHSSTTVRKGALGFTIDHRAHKTFLSGEDAWFDYLGLDAGGLKIGLGFRYGILDFLDAGFLRLSNGVELFDIYEFDSKIKFLHQKRAFINAAIRLGGTWFVQKDYPDRFGFLSQLMVDRRFFGTLLVGAGVAFHSLSGVEGTPLSRREPAAAVNGYIEWRPVDRFSINGDISANVAGDGNSTPVVSFSTRFLTYRHSFSLGVSNSQYMAADGVVAGTHRGFDELVFGFQIMREFDIAVE